MLDIEYKGANTVVCATKKTRVVFDPASAGKVAASLVRHDDIVVVTEDRFVAEQTGRLLFDGPGEYEVGDVAIKGIPAQRHLDSEADVHGTTIYRLEVGGLRVAVLGNVAPKLHEDQLEQIGVIDLVVLPVGGNGYTLDATAAAAVVRQLDPKGVIPIHYQDSAIKYDVPQDTVAIFEQELGAPVEKVSRLKLKSISALPEVLTIYEVARS